MEEMIQIFADKKPILGICLGHQAIAEVFGGQLRLAKTVMHGKQSQMRVEGNSPIFNGFQGDVEIMRYHSIVIDKMPKDFIVTARTTDDDEIMAIQHKQLPIFGLQFHPESIGSPEGLQMIEQFVREVVR
jgi:anthranilate synthase component 2